MKVLELLMQSSDLYAPYTGVALTSYLENNRDLDKIVVHFLSDHVSDVNKDRMIRTVHRYGRIIYIYELEETIHEIECAGFKKYHGSYTTLCKLFMLDKINTEAERVLYVDSDTLCNGSLRELLSIKLDNCICAMAEEMNVLYQIKNRIPNYDHWYNAGVILFHTDVWKRDKCRKQIGAFVKEYNPQLRLADQDLLNLLFRDRIIKLQQRYNYMYTYTLLPFPYGNKAWKWGEQRTQQLEREKSAAVIYHCMPVFNRHPWDTGAYVPEVVQWDYFLHRSEWKNDFEKSEKRQGITGKVQEILFRKCSPFVYFFFYRLAIERVSRQGAKGLPYVRLMEQAEEFLKLHKKHTGG